MYLFCLQCLTQYVQIFLEGTTRGEIRRKEGANEIGKQAERKQKRRNGDPNETNREDI